MGNHTSCLKVNNNKETIQLVHSDGAVQILHKPLSAAQIVQEFPQYLVCRSDSFYIGQKTPSLSPDDQLNVGNKYFLLPQHFFQSPLSLLSLASLISPPPSPKAPPTSTAHLSAPLRSIERASVFCEPFEIQKSDVGGGLRIRVCSEFVSKLMEDGRLNVDERGRSVNGDNSTDDEPGRLCNTPELQKDYARLVQCKAQCWRPKLETIKEKEKIGNKIFIKIRRSGQNSSGS
jgi:hypothetical protein